METKRNTQKEDGLDLLIRAMGLGSASDAILSQESAGQHSFVNSDALPTDMYGDTRAVLEAAGVKFLGIVPNDPIFQYVELPDGWKKVATDHSMHSNLVDDQKRIRASIFYKAAFYDRSAHITAWSRFGVGIDYDKLGSGVAEAIVLDCGTEVYRSSGFSFDTSGDWRVRDEAECRANNQACAWLDYLYPEWKNPAKYWDEK